MKKRIILIITSVVALLVVAGLVIFTVVSKTKKEDTNPIDPPVSDNQDVNLDMPDFDFGLDSDAEIEYKKNNIDLSYLVGEVVTDSIFVENYETIKESFPFIEKNASGEFIAKEVGNATATIITENNQITLHIYVYEEGDGSKENPYVIVNAESLVKHFNECNKDVYYIQKANIDLADFNGGNWVPLGTNARPFMSNYDGNGYKIYNMNIVITEENFEQFVTKQNVNGTQINSLMVGFFGVIYGEEQNFVEIKDVTLAYANVDTSAIDNKIFKSSDLFKSIDYISISIFAGNVTYANIENVVVNGKINSSMNAKSYCHGFVSQVAGAIGVIDYSTVNKLGAQVEFNAEGVGNVDASGNILGSAVAGLIGKVYDNCTLSTCVAQPTIIAKNYKETYISGLFGTIGDTDSTGNTITDSFVKLPTIGVKAGGKYNASVAGFVVTLYAENEISNSRVYNPSINNKSEYLGTSNTAGFVLANYGTIYNSLVSGGAVEGVESAGFVLNNKSNILYTESFDGEYVVNTTVNGELGMAGFVYSNSGSIVAENQVDMYARLNWVKLNQQFTTYYSGIGSYMSAGFVHTANAGSEISNFNITVNMYDVVNGAGAIGEVKGDTKISNLIVSSTVNTLAVEEGKNYSGASFIASGLVGIIDSGANLSLENVNVNISVNASKDENKAYSLGVFGTLVGINYGNKLTIKGVKVQSVYVNADVVTKTQNLTEITIGAVCGIATSNDQFSLSKGELKINVGEVILAGVSKKINDFNYYN